MMMNDDWLAVSVFVLILFWLVLMILLYDLLGGLGQKKRWEDPVLTYIYIYMYIYIYVYIYI